jgi:hypothetical protein
MPTREPALEQPATTTPAREVTPVAVTKRIAAEPAPPPLRNAAVTFVGLDLVNRVLEIRHKLTSDEGGREVLTILSVRDGESMRFVSPGAESRLQTPEGFEDAAAVIKEFVAAMDAYGDSLQT